MTRMGRGLLPSVVRYHDDGSTDVGYPAQAMQSRIPTTPSFRETLHGRGLRDLPDAASMPYQFVDAPGMVQLKTWLA